MVKIPSNIMEDHIWNLLSNEILLYKSSGSVSFYRNLTIDKWSMLICEFSKSLVPSNYVLQYMTKLYG